MPSELFSIHPSPEVLISLVDIEDAFLNVPVAATPSNHEVVQSVAEIFVAKQVTEERLVQPENIPL
jgi:hypothetical protein